MSKPTFLIDLIKGLSENRFSNKDEWIIIGLIINRQEVNKEEPLKYWASKCPFTDKDYEKHLLEHEDNPKYKKYRFTILYEWFRMDNKKLYNEFIKENGRWDIFSMSSDKEFAEMFYNLCPNKYICVEDKCWFAINTNNVWEVRNKIPASISTDIAENYRRVIIECEKHITEAKSKLTDAGHLSKSDAMKQLDSYSETLVKLNKKLGSASTVRNIKEFLPSLYKDDKVFDKMDANRYLFACENKVFDLEAKIWRKIKPEDYISITTGYEYEEETKENIEIQKKVDEFLRSCFKTDGEYIYFLTIIARTFLGTRDDRWSQKFYIWTGSGSNGKSLVSGFVNSVLGNYYHQINPSTLTLPPSKVDGANTQIAPAVKKRALFSSEPTISDKADGAFAPKHKLQQSTLKMLTGGEPVSARDNYEKGKDAKPFLPMFGLFLLCNTIPEVDVDEAIERRFEVLNFPYKFVPKEKEHCIENEKPACSKIGSLIKTKEYIMAFLHILTRNYIKVFGEDIKIEVPKPVREYSDNYIETQLKVKNWFFQNYKPTSDILDKKLWIKGTMLLDQYKKDTKDDVSDIKFYKDLEVKGVRFEVERSQGNLKTLKGYERKAHECKNHSVCKGETLYGDYCKECYDTYMKKKAEESSTLKNPKLNGHNPNLRDKFFPPTTNTDTTNT